MASHEAPNPQGHVSVSASTQGGRISLTFRVEKPGMKLSEVWLENGGELGRCSQAGLGLALIPVNHGLFPSSLRVIGLRTPPA